MEQLQDTNDAAGAQSRLTVGLGVFKKEWFKISEYPSDFIPSGAKTFIGIDHASPDGDCTVKGFYDPETGEFHIQEILSSPNVELSRADK